MMGKLHATPVRGEEVFSFAYEKDWLASPHAQRLDPNLRLYEGEQYVPDQRRNFGMFLDSSPDRWGRMLMNRREALYARRNEQEPRTLRESDYLLGVYDGHRMGALRFKRTPSGPFLDDNHQHASPPWSMLRDLEYISRQAERPDASEEPEYHKWLDLLVAPGSSLGGARPKASVLDPDDQLWIAKFPSRSDDRDVGAWEKVAGLLADRCGIPTAESRLEKFSKMGHTFISRRFDRSDAGYRKHFVSAMTLLGYRDGIDHRDGASYLELVALIIEMGSDVQADLMDLWKRMAFNVLISNTDDHLRNHGFLLTPAGWKLSPAFDLNPEPAGIGLTLNINERENALDLDLVREVAPHFRLDEGEANSIIQKMEKEVGAWRDLAASRGISREEIALMRPAFNVAV
ncbi:MAG: HipA domain-containing protein [Balneolaceae bacterium]|nr:HipA domain-containing protein [Balneolaceae bacterium]